MKGNNKVEIGNFLFKKRGILPTPFILLLLILGDSPYSIKFLSLKIAGIIVAVIGEIIRFSVAGFAPEKTSGRGMKIEASQIVDYGLYSVVRNPLYLGNFLIFSGFLIFSSNLFLLIFGIIIFWVYYYFIVLAEENYLLNKFGKSYEEFLNRVPRFLPKSFKIKKPPHKFNLEKALLREKDTIFIWVISFFLMNERLCNFCKPKFSHIITFLALFIGWILINIFKRVKK